PDGRRLAFTGTFFSDLETAPRTRIGILELNGTSKPRFLQSSTNNDRQPLWSPCGRWLAFLSDREQAGNFQLMLTDTGVSAEASGTPALPGCVETLSWSQDGQKILLGV